MPRVVIFFQMSPIFHVFFPQVKLQRLHEVAMMKHTPHDEGFQLFDSRRERSFTSFSSHKHTCGHVGTDVRKADDHC